MTMEENNLISERSLTDKEPGKPRMRIGQKRLFAAKYLETWSVQKAADLAGINKATGEQWLKKDPTIKSIIAKKVTTQLKTFDVDNKKIIAKLIEIAFSVDSKTRTSDCLRALELLGKANGLFAQEETQESTIPKVEITINQPQDDITAGLVAPTEETLSKLN